jgi:chemotaxis protein methyltransferase CheR
MVTTAEELDGRQRLSAAGFTRLAQFITAELGIKMPEQKLTMVESRLLRRVRELGLSSLDEYASYFFDTATEEERDHLINSITTNKTDFFREPGHFEFLTGVAIPSLRMRPGVPLKVWSAGCSSGEEAYTLAMVLSEYGATRPEFRFAILGTDVSTRVLDRARAGIYTTDDITPISTELRRKYLWRSKNPSEPQARVAPQLRQAVSFHRLNLMDAHYGVRDIYDVIFFRNVMIYFDRRTQEAVLNKLCLHLAPGGYLFVGHSESLSGLDCPVVSVRASVFRKVGR